MADSDINIRKLYTLKIWEDYRRLGFVDAGPGVQFGYPVQQMVLPFRGGAL